MYSRIQSLLHRLVYRIGDDKETLLLKKIWWLFVAACVVFPGIEVITAWLIGEPEVAALSSIFVVLCLGLLVIFHFHRNHIEWYGLAFQLFIVAITSIKTMLTGGLVYTAGVVYVGLIGPIQAIIFPNRKRAVAIFLLYCAAVIGGTLAQPYLWPDYRNPGAYFILTYITKFLFGTFFVFFALQYFTTQLRKMKQAEARQLKELDDLKTKFFVDITHEFRTPLSVIIGMAEEIRHQPSRWLEEGTRLIKNNGLRLLTFTNQILDLSKLEAGAMIYKPVHGDIVSYTQRLVESFRSLAASKQIRIDFDAETPSFEMDFDPDKIRNICSNLLSNAIKFTPKDGCIKVGQQLTKIDGKEYWEIAVSDNGIGIPAEMLHRVFDRYFQVQNHDTPATSGTGLGLALARELAQWMAGDIRVESLPGKGSTFTFFMPVRHTGSPYTISSLDAPDPELYFNNTVIEHTPPAPKKALRLLLVEDNPDVVRYLEAVLSKHHQIEIATDGQAGWEMALEQIPDLIISDVMMPKMDGFQLCSNLKSDLRTSHIPVVLLTARADAASRLTGLKHGADAYLAKPFDVEELLVHIRKLVELRQLLQAHYKTVDLLEKARESDGKMPQEDAFLKEVRDTLEKHLTNDDFGIPELCRALGMSRSQLYRKFQALTNVTVHHFLQDIRLHRAKELLEHSDMTVSEIAFEVGYKNLSHFSRSFSEAWGASPGKIRRNKAD